MVTAPPAPDHLYHQNTLSSRLRDFCWVRRPYLVSRTIAT